jgi:hypothetical protein
MGCPRAVQRKGKSMALSVPDERTKTTQTSLFRASTRWPHEHLDPAVIEVSLDASGVKKNWLIRRLLSKARTKSYCGKVNGRTRLMCPWECPGWPGKAAPFLGRMQGKNSGYHAACWAIAWPRRPGRCTYVRDSAGEEKEWLAPAHVRRTGWRTSHCVCVWSWGLGGVMTPPERQGASSMYSLCLKI